MSRRVARPQWGLAATALAGLALASGAGCGGAAGGPRDLEAQRRDANAPELPPLDGKVDDNLRVQLAELLIHEGAHENAVPIIRDALDRNPLDARLHYLLGTLLRDRGVYDEAERELRRAVEIDPKLAPAHSALGILYDLERRGPEAERHHREAVTLDPLAARFQNNLGFCLYLQGRYPEAIAAYEAALKRAPTAHQVFVNLGFAYAAQGRDADASRMFRQAGGEAGALVNLAVARELLGHPEKARALYQRALSRDPRQAAALNNLEALEANSRLVTTVPQPASPPPEKTP